MSNPLAPTEDWSPANRFTAASTGDLLLSNTGGHDIRWTRTPDDALPAAHPATSHLVRPGVGTILNVSAGDRIWLAANPSGTALIDPLP